MGRFDLGKRQLQHFHRRIVYTTLEKSKISLRPKLQIQFINAHFANKHLNVLVTCKLQTRVTQQGQLLGRRPR